MLTDLGRQVLIDFAVKLVGAFFIIGIPIANKVLELSTSSYLKLRHRGGKRNRDFTTQRDLHDLTNIASKLASVCVFYF